MTDYRLPHEQIKELLRWMLKTAREHNFKPVRFQCPYWEDMEEVWIGGDDCSHFVPATSIDGIPIVFQERACQLICEDYIVMSIWRVNDVDLRYDFTDSRFAE